MFRRPVNTDDTDTDNGFESEITFIWAFGQSGQEFYKDDQLKFHGKPGTTGVGLGKKGIHTQLNLTLSEIVFAIRRTAPMHYVLASIPSKILFIYFFWPKVEFCPYLNPGKKNF